VGDWQVHTSNLDDWDWELAAHYSDDCLGDHVEENVEYVFGKLKIKLQEGFDEWNKSGEWGYTCDCEVFDGL
jgi:hypothetical protein